jgi:hypothetical protein
VVHIAQQLRSEGKSAFFLRLEHISTEFESAFEEGNYQEFQDWLAGQGTGWILLDSIDEARLRDPADFARAIRMFAGRIKAVLAGC